MVKYFIRILFKMSKKEHELKRFISYNSRSWLTTKRKWITLGNEMDHAIKQIQKERDPQGTPTLSFWFSFPALLNDQDRKTPN